MKREKFIVVMLVLIVCAFIFFIVQVCNNGIIKKSLRINGVGGVKYSTSAIPKNVLGYLKSQKDISDSYGEKKIAIYYTGKECPFAEVLANTINPLKEKQEYTSAYFFHPEAAAVTKAFPTQQGVIAYIDFRDMCGDFCIVNPKKNQILTIENMDQKKAEKVTAILSQFKDW